MWYNVQISNQTNLLVNQQFRCRTLAGILKIHTVRYSSPFPQLSNGYEREELDRRDHPSTSIESIMKSTQCDPRELCLMYGNEDFVNGRSVGYS
jgi:hypothetical protein